MKRIVLFLAMFVSLAASPKAVVFDFNGVMMQEPSREVLYPFLHETLQLSRAEFERVYEDILSGQTDMDFWRSLAKEKEIKLSIDWGKHFHAIMKNSFINRDMYFLVDHLKQKQIQVVMFSNMNKDVAKRFEEMGLFKPFDLRIFSYEIGASKPNPQAFKILLEQLNLSAKDIVFIDDNRENIEAGQALGIDAIQFQSSSQIQQEIEKRLVLQSRS